MSGLSVFRLVGNVSVNGGYGVAEVAEFGLPAHMIKTGRFTNDRLPLEPQIAGNLTPSANSVYSLGNVTHRWKDLYLAGNTLYLGDTVLSAGEVAGTMRVHDISDPGNTAAVVLTQTAETVAGNAVAIGSSPTAQGSNAVAIGLNAGVTSQSVNAVAVGFQAGANVQAIGAVAIGVNAGSNTQGQYATAVGPGAGSTSQGNRAVAVGLQAGETSQGSSAVAIGYFAGQTSQGVEAVAIGLNAGRLSQERFSVGIGSGAGDTNQRSYATAVGYLAGANVQAIGAVAIGVNAGSNTQGSNAVAVGSSAGQTSQSLETVAMGYLAGQTLQGFRGISVGSYAGYDNQKENAIAIGHAAGGNAQGNISVAIGHVAGRFNQGSNSVAIGSRAGYSNQAANCIVINATGGVLNNTVANSAVIKPVRDVASVSRRVALYDSGSGEVSTNSGHLTMDASNNVLMGTTSVDATGSSLQIGGHGQQTLNTFNTSGLMGGSVVLRATDGLQYSGGAVVFGASQGNFAAIKGVLTDGGGNSRGDLIFATRIASTDATLTTTMHIAGGNVGIGMTSPQATLDVNGVLHLRSGTASETTPGTALGVSVDAASRTQTYISFGEAGSGNDWAYLRQIGGSDAYHMALDFHDYADDARFSIRSVNSVLNPDTIATRFAVTGNGNVGIGTGTPNAPLDVLGGEGTYDAPNFGNENRGAIHIRSSTTNRRNAITFSSSSTAAYSHENTAQAGIYVNNDNSTGTTMHFATTQNYATGPQARVTIGNTGNVGIGTTNPTYKLDVSGTARITGGGKYVVQGSVDGGATRGIYMWDDADSNWGIYMAQSGAGLSLAGGTAVAADGYTSHSIRSRVASSGGFVWENNSEARVMSLRGSDGYLSVAGYVNRILPSAVNYGSFGSIGVSGTTNTWAGISFSDVARTFMVNGVSGAGNGQGIFANDNAWVWRFDTGTNSFVIGSDSRIKKNIQDIDDGEALQKIRAIEPKTYEYVDTKSRGNVRVYGFIAQQIESVLPHAVVTMKNHAIPDIYAWATKSAGEDGTISMDAGGVPVTFDVGETVCMYTTEDGNEKETWYNQKCTWVSDDKTSFRVDETETAIPTGPVFVSGRQVDDFKMLNKTAIFTVAVSALQEADREIQRLKAQVAVQNDLIAVMNDRFASMESLMASMNSRLAIMDDRFATVNDRFAALESQ